MTLRLGTRASPLARCQSGDVVAALAQVGVDAELVPMTSDGDRTRAALSSLGGTGVFAAALRTALLAGECDAVVHSYKDLPTAPHPGLRIAASPPREDYRDALCARAPLAELPEGATIGTGSPRRRAQLLRVRPDLDVRDIRGNVNTRLAMVTGGDLDGVVLAAAGLRRIGRENAITELFDWPTAPAQGALAIEVREGDDVAAAVASIGHSATSTAARVERDVLAALEAGCAAPVAATAVVHGERIRLEAVAYHPDGTSQHGTALGAPLAEAGTLGQRAAQCVLDAGADAWWRR